MKLGKPTKNFRRPSDKFLARTRPEILVPPLEGPVNIYLDDDRPVPEGWTVARTSDVFFGFLEETKDIAARVEHLSLDGFLGPRDLDGISVITMLVTKFQLNPTFMPKLKIIGLHNINRAVSKQMDHILATRIPEARRNTFYTIWGTPQLPEQLLIQ